MSFNHPTYSHNVRMFKNFTQITSRMLSLFSLFLSDIDECLTENGGCNQTCVNKPGSFECQCSAGYALGDDGKSCSGMFMNVIVVVVVVVVVVIVVVVHECH